jgi:transposase
VYLATRPVDFRKGLAGLALVVQGALGHDPFSGAIYVFRSKRGDRLRLVAWDRTGLLMVHKQLGRSSERLEADQAATPGSLIM